MSEQPQPINVASQLERVNSVLGKKSPLYAELNLLLAIKTGQEIHVPTVQALASLPGAEEGRISFDVLEFTSDWNDYVRGKQTLGTDRVASFFDKGLHTLIELNQLSGVTKLTYRLVMKRLVARHLKELAK